MVLARKDDPYWCVPQFGGVGDGFIGDGQFLLWQDSDNLHHLLIPLVDGDFRTVLQGANGKFFLEVESPKNGADRLPLLCYLASGRDPYALIRNAGGDIAGALGTVVERSKKAVPAWMDLFGWCTWDAYYQSVSAESVLESLRFMQMGGLTPGFMILDDGWLDSDGDYLNAMEPHPEKFPHGLSDLIERVTGEYGVRCFGVWHTLQGYWAGVNPQGQLAAQWPMLHGRNRIRPWLGDGDPEIDLHLICPDQAAAFYDAFYQRLQAQGVRMVKVDNQSALERFTEGVCHRVPAMRSYQQAMQVAAEKYMQDGSLHCMSHGSDVVMHLQSANVIRNSADYLPGANADHQKGHIARNAFNGLFFSLFAIADWDMFQTTHEHSTFHAAARAISGGPVYVSDKPGKHDFALIQKLIYSDDGLCRPLRFPEPALPSPCCLYQNPQFGDKPLKLFNHLHGIGLLGLFHCVSGEEIVKDSIGLADLPVLDSGLPYAVWWHFGRRLRLIRAGETVPVQLMSLGCELITFSPVHNGCAPLGLLNKFNGPASLISYARLSGGVAVRCKDGGRIGFYCGSEPTSVLLDGEAVASKYDPVSGLLEVLAPVGQPHEIEVLVAGATGSIF